MDKAANHCYWSKKKKMNIYDQLYIYLIILYYNILYYIHVYKLYTFKYTL